MVLIFPLHAGHRKRFGALSFMLGNPCQHAVLVCLEAAWARVDPDRAGGFGGVLETNEAGAQAVGFGALEGRFGGGGRVGTGVWEERREAGCGSLIRFGRHGVLQPGVAGMVVVSQSTLQGASSCLGCSR